MKAITGNRLSDGRVVFLAANDVWTVDLAVAALFSEEEAQAALAAARRRTREVADAYLIEVDKGRPAGREALRESIRAAGPTVRRDLGRQAEARE